MGAAAAAFVLCAFAHAATGIQIDLSSQISYGDPVLLEIKLANVEERIENLLLAPVAGLKLEGPFSRGTEQHIVNGRVTRYNNYAYRITPDPGRVGVFTIGPVTVTRRNAPPLESGVIQLAVYKRPGLSLSYTCEISAREGVVGTPFIVTYRLAYPRGSLATGSSDPFERFFSRGSAFQLDRPPVVDLPGAHVRAVKAFPDRPAQRGGSAEVELLLQQDFVAKADGTALEAQCFAFEVTPFRPGTLTLAPTRARAELLTGQQTRVRDGFFPRTVPETRVFEARTEERVYTVLPLPVQGRPEGFTGAVGRYTIEVSTEDVIVNAFDPIALTVRIRGEGLLEELPPPNWTGLDWLLAQFDVSRDVDAGRVEGKVKVFQQTIRPRSDAVTHIPPLPFPHYDPWQKQYVVARSEPIPITVRPSRTVGAEDAYRRDPADAAARFPAHTAAPAPILEQSGVAANFQHMGRPSRFVSASSTVGSPSFLLILLAPVAFFGALAMAVRLAHRSPEAIARQRAFSRAREALSRAEADVEAVSGAFQDYFRDRFQMPPGEMTPEQLAGALARRPVPEGLVRRAADFLTTLLASRFGVGGDARELSASALAVIKDVEQCRMA